jgi:transposase-like protein
MPSEVTGPVEERERFIDAYLAGFYTLTELADHFGMSRQKLHRWLARHNVRGMKDSSIGRVRRCTFRIGQALK